MGLEISFKGKRILVTGASRGLGYALVEELHAQQAEIIALAGNSDNLSKLKAEFPNISTICMDLTNWNGTREALSKIGPVDCLVNNAGVGDPTPFLDITEADFDKTISINLKAIFNVSQVVAKGMIQAGNGGSIVNISSILGSRVFYPGASIYSASKAGLNMLTKSMAVELGPYKIRVNSVNPGIFETDMTKHILEKAPDGGPEYISRTPMRRIGTAKEVVNAILFVMSDASGMIDGENLIIDGGHSIT